MRTDRLGKVLCFGELLIRLCPDNEGDWLQNNRLQFYIGGAELNVAKALALWGTDVKYFTALPDNGLSAQITGDLENKGIDISAIHYAGKRIGLYYLTPGQELKHDALIYDRAGSSFAGLQTGVIDWDEILKDVSWFHFSAICPAIGRNVADVCLEAIEAASTKNITVSIDLNYRSKLWQYGKQPKEIIPALAAHCDVIMGNIWATELMLDIPVTGDIHHLKAVDRYLEHALFSSQEVIKQYPKCKVIANTFRFSEGTGIKYYSALFLNNQAFRSKEHETPQVIDKAGSGDCFMAGLIYGFKTGMNTQETLEFATAAAFGKLLIAGDSTTLNVEAIKNIIL